MRDVQAAGDPSLTVDPERSTVPADTPKPRGHARLVLGIAAAVVALDATSKAIVVATLSHRPPVRLLGGHLLLLVTRNSGAAFGLAEGDTVIFSAIAIVVVVVIVRVAPRLASTGWAWALGLLLGGAVGNLADRIFRSPGIFRGAVVDWIDLRFWPVFNLADAAITVGAILAVLLSLRGIPATRPRDDQR